MTGSIVHRHLAGTNGIASIKIPATAATMNALVPHRRTRDQRLGAAGATTAGFAEEALMPQLYGAL